MYIIKKGGTKKAPKILRKREKSINISRRKKRKNVVKETVKRWHQKGTKIIKGNV
jgi:hypothetical protein